jgi:peptide deformylase
MAILPIVTYGHDVLKSKARPVKKIDERIRALAGDMSETMHHFKGVGLAAPQVGEPLAMFVASGAAISADEESPHADLVAINPVVKNTAGSVKLEEGCLSIPQIRLDVERAESLTLEYTDLEGVRHTIQTAGLLAEVVQHETDHLNGMLIIDKISALKRKLLYQKKLEEIKKKTMEALSQERA